MTTTTAAVGERRPSPTAAAASTARRGRRRGLVPSRLARSSSSSSSSSSSMTMMVVVLLAVAAAIGRASCAFVPPPPMIIIPSSSPPTATTSSSRPLSCLALESPPPSRVSRVGVGSVGSSSSFPRAEKRPPPPTTTTATTTRGGRSILIFAEPMHVSHVEAMAENGATPPHSSSNAASFADAIPREEDDRNVVVAVASEESIAPNNDIAVVGTTDDRRRATMTTMTTARARDDDAPPPRGESSHRPRAAAAAADAARAFFPSVPISYDERGMVQADAAPSEARPVVDATFAVDPDNSVDVVVVGGDSDYPDLVKFLFRKDDNGRTLATKLFNAALLAASFGYVFVSVFSIDRGMTRGWSPAEIGMRIPLDTWASYENSLSEKPVATKTIINIVIYLLGDWLSQTLFRRGNVLDFDASRTLRNGFVGMCFGPAVHEYYEFSDWILPVEGLTLGITNRAFKILMDQTIYLSVKCSIYIMAIAVLNGQTVEDGADNVRNRLKPIMFTAWKFWPLVHCVTYGLIPARHRILWVNSVDLVWNAILASKARGDDDGIDGSDGESDGKSNDDDGRASKANDGEGGHEIFQRARFVTR
ncbi:hypothetical protein ACHAW5_004908 [Stephanodiscus triporus]|uniref:Uncharacterized protein n=1 Tax=Stephanodiscus triporus TaxID=2934178 RepID=A0ABD3P2V1_9STRA